ncbi:tungsten formylmethanofuran dehydrogenase, partial [Nitratireductor sp. GCM10026969]
AQVGGRPVTTPVTNFERLSDALAKANYAAFLCSGHGTHHLALEMLQGLVSDLNRKTRAAMLVLPESEAGWGGTLVSGWTTGFPMRTGFAQGAAEHDPWRFDVRRMLGAGEADVHLWVAARENSAPAHANGSTLIALTKTAEPVAEAAVTIPVGAPGADHDAVLYSSSRSTFVGRTAGASSQLPSAASILKAIMEELPVKMDTRC